MVAIAETRRRILQGICSSHKNGITFPAPLSLRAIVIDYLDRFRIVTDS